MAWKTLRLRITGVRPILLHNGQLADPLNQHSKAMKQISGKRNKTDSDHLQMAKLEFMGALYWNKDLGVILPPEVLEATAICGAKKLKSGPKAKAGLIFEKMAKLEYDGPTGLEELWADERFRLTIGVKVGASRVMRTRPKFDEWSAVIEFDYDDAIANKTEVVEWFYRAGMEVGMCDWRPKYGRFSVAFAGDDQAA